MKVHSILTFNQQQQLEPEKELNQSRQNEETRIAAKKGVQCGYKKNRWREIEWLIEKIRQIQLDSSEEEGPTDPVKVLPEAGVNNLDSHLHLLATSIQHTSPIHLHTQLLQYHLCISFSFLK